MITDNKIIYVIKVVSPLITNCMTQVPVPVLWLEMSDAVASAHKIALG